MSDTYALVLTTAGSRDEADAIADALVDRRLAACVQLIDIDSTYRWQGAVVREPEVLLIIKTRADRYHEIESTIVELHSYDTPEVVLVPIGSGLPAYLGWITESTSGSARPAAPD